MPASDPEGPLPGTGLDVTPGPSDWTPASADATPLRGAAGCGRAAAPLLAPGSKLAGRYNIVRFIAAGGMGEVYEAQDVMLGTEVALKTIRPEVAARGAVMERFRRETLLARRVTHPNVCRIFDLGHQPASASGPEVTFLTMELLSGETLRQCLKRRGRFRAEDALPLVVQMAAALTAAHDAGVVHRDFKSANVMLVPVPSPNAPPRVVVTDFGLAWAATGNLASITSPEDLVGSPAYMSPEQVEGCDVTATSDVYAFGVVLYEMMTGRLPFEGSSALVDGSQAHPGDARVTAASCARPASLLGSRDLRCLERKADDRFASADHVVKALRAESVPPQSARRRPLRLAAAVLAVAIAAGGAWLARGRLHPESARGTPSIAVLPFVNLGSDKEQEYFSDGLAEDLLNNLAKTPGLRVVARPSSFQFKGTKEDVRSVGEKLDVGNVLEGSVRKEGNKLRIAAQLVQASDGVVLWSETYDRELNGIFGVQDDIARSVAGSLKVKLLGGTAPTPPARGGNGDAYNAYLQGQYFFNKYSAEGYEKAVGYYEQALKLDPDYVPAWAGLSRASSIQAAAGNVPVEGGYRRARDAAERAIRLDPTLAIGYASLAWIDMSYDFNWDGADAAIKRALALEPGNATAIRYAAYLHATQGRLEEALVLDRRAESQDPLDPAVRCMHGNHAFWAGHLEEAKAALQKALELDPAYSGHGKMAEILLAEGRAQEALPESMQETLKSARLLAMGAAHHMLGRKTDGDAVLAELIAWGQSRAAYQIAGLHAYRGEADRAFEWLERAYAQHDAGLIWVKVDASLKNLRGDPRFAAFLRKMRLPV